VARGSGGSRPRRSPARTPTCWIRSCPGCRSRSAGRGTGGQGVPRQPGNPPGAGPRPRPLESWQKWSFPISPPARTAVRWPAGGRCARGGGSAGSHWPAGRSWPGPGPGGEPRCEVELTEIRTPGQHWWTLGFEATGPAGLLRSELQATAALVFAQPCPVAWNPARMTPGPMRSGWASGRAAPATPAPERQGRYYRHRSHRGCQALPAHGRSQVRSDQLAAGRQHSAWPVIRGNAPASAVGHDDRPVPAALSREPPPDSKPASTAAPPPRRTPAASPAASSASRT